MPDQAELRRRIRAAMALSGVTSWEHLEEVTPFSRSLLKDLGTPRATVEEKHLRPIAAALDIPYAWFTVPDIAGALAGSEDASLAERVEALEGQLHATRQLLDSSVNELRAAVAALSEESVTRAQRDAARDREQQALQERAQQQRERQQGERDTKHVPPRRRGEAP